ncbi:MAG TPA: tetratricopeptide repeat protein [Gammaproteobacteria bacterium]|nr:tetratricopeptide repeat protein [Gammaproteobacteria bacterium]
MAMVTLKRFYPAFILFVVLFLGACTTAQKPVPVEERSREADTVTDTLPVEESVTPSAKPEPLPPPVSEETGTKAEDISREPAVQQQSSQAVVALLDNADQSMASGRHDRAVASIERALRIDPKNPILWQRLGQIRLRQERWDQAIATARKSNLLAAGNDRLRVDNWLIIARAMEGKGDKAGAREAIEQARKLHR